MKANNSYLALGLTFAFILCSLSLPINAESQDLNSYEQKRQEIEQIKKEAEVKKQEAKDLAEKKTAEIKAEAEAKANEAKTKVDQKRQELRKQVCQKNADKLNSQIQTKAQSARAFYERFSGFSDKVDRFIEAKSLDVDNYSLLYQAVKDSSANADEAIMALEKLKFVVDCDDVDLTSANAQSYKEALIRAKDALKEYKTALVNLLTGVVTSYNANYNSPSEDNSTAEDTSNQNIEGANNAQ
jgi:predicted RNase H-like HicB family nuclease